MWGPNGRDGLDRTLQSEVNKKILRGHQSGSDHRFASVPVDGLWRSLAAASCEKITRNDHAKDYDETICSCH